MIIAHNCYLVMYFVVTANKSLIKCKAIQPTVKNPTTLLILRRPDWPNDHQISS